MTAEKKMDEKKVGEANAGFEVVENHPLIPVYGRFRDDPTWDEFMQAIREARHDTAEAERKGLQLCNAVGAMMFACKRLAQIQADHTTEERLRAHPRRAATAVCHCYICKIPLPDLSAEGVEKLVEESNAGFQSLLSSARDEGAKAVHDAMVAHYATAPCPYVKQSRGGTAHCSLAEGRSRAERDAITKLLEWREADEEYRPGQHDGGEERALYGRLKKATTDLRVAADALSEKGGE